MEHNNQPCGAWRFESQGNGAFVTVYAPDGRSCFLQGDDAGDFMRQADDIYNNEDIAVEHGTESEIAELCRSYDEIMVDHRD